MRYRTSALASTAVCLSLLLAQGCGASAAAPPHPSRSTESTVPALSPVRAYPASPKDDVDELLHGQHVKDSYRWLEKADDPKVVEWRNLQSAYAADYVHRLKPDPALDKSIEEMHRARGPIYVRASGTAVSSVDLLPGHSRRSVLIKQESQTRVLLDGREWFEKRQEQPTAAVVAPDGSHVLVVAAVDGRDERRMYVVDASGGNAVEPPAWQHLLNPDPKWVPGSTLSVLYRWTPDATNRDRPSRWAAAEWRRFYLPAGGGKEREDIIRPATGNGRDQEVLLLAGDAKNVNVLALKVDDRQTQRRYTSYVGSLSERKLSWKLVHSGAVTEGEPRLAPNGDVYLLRWAPEKSGELVRVYAKGMLLREPEPVIRGADNRVLRDVSIGDKSLLAQYLEDAAAVVELVDLRTKSTSRLPLSELGTVKDLDIVGPDRFQFTFSSFVRSPSTFLVTDGATRIIAEAKLDLSDRLQVARLFATSRDGAKIPYFTVTGHGATTTKPTILYAYGGFGVDVGSEFVPRAAAWALQGGTYVAASVRGGTEYGEPWHESGQGLGKINSVLDVIAVEESILEHRIASAETLSLRGGSNGGLVMGAAAIMRPDLCKSVVLILPITDILRYELSGSGNSWIAEYGTVKDKAIFEQMLRYSPYQNVRADKAYPAMMVLAAAGEDRVSAMHAYKLVAALQQSSPTGGPALLRILTEGGHGGLNTAEGAIKIDREALLFSRDAQRGSR